MTYQEKRLNRKDLHQYKDKNNTVTALVPGLNHMETVGGVNPLKRGAIRLMQYGEEVGL